MFLFRFDGRGSITFHPCLRTGISIPKIKPTHHAAKHLAPPSLFQFEVDVFGAAAEHVEIVEKIVRPPFTHHRLQIPLANGHIGCRRFAQVLQISSHFGLAFHHARIVDVRVSRGRYGIGKVYHSAGLKTWRCVSMSKKASKAPSTSEMVIEAQTPVRPLPPALMNKVGTR